MKNIIKVFSQVPAAIYILVFGVLAPFISEIFSKKLYNFFWNSFTKMMAGDPHTQHYPDIIVMLYTGVCIGLVISMVVWLIEKVSLAGYRSKKKKIYELLSVSGKTSVHEVSSGVIAGFFVMLELCSIYFTYLRFG